MTEQTNNKSLALIARRLKALADESRLIILHSLCSGEKNVSSLVDETELGQANLSKHLRILRQEGLVAARRKQRNVYYSLTSDLPVEICNLICRSLESKANIETAILQHYWSAIHE